MISSVLASFLSSVRKFFHGCARRLATPRGPLYLPSINDRTLDFADSHPDFGRQ
jgi:hypothetical protein